MRIPNVGRWLGLLAVLLLGNTTAPAGDAKVDVKVVKFPGLDQTLKEFNGKVIVVDFWADY